MAYKYEDVFQLMQSTADSVVENQETWKRFLNTAAMNYKRPFHNQLLIFNQRPDATACATFDYWNQKMGRYVKKGSKGIATIDLVSQKKEILFDVADTESSGNVPVPIWSVTEEMHGPLAAALQEHFDTEIISDNLTYVLFEVGFKTSDSVLPSFIESIKDCYQGSRLSGLDDRAFEIALRETFSSSLNYELLKRCGLNPDYYTDSFNFSFIDCFDTYDTLAELGSLLNKVSNEVLKDISLAVRSIEKILNIKDNSNKEVVNDGHNLHNTRGLSDPERIHSETRDEFREVRNDEAELSTEREERGVYSNADEGNAESASERDRSEGDGEREQPGSADGVEGGRDGGVEGVQPDEVGGADEQLPDGSRGDNSNGDDFRLTPEEEKYLSLSGTSKDKHPDLSLEYVLTNVLKHHKYMSVTGAEIQNFFLDNSNEDERIAYMRAAYNKDFTEIITPVDEYRIGYHADDEGLEVWIGAYLGATSRTVVPWPIIVDSIEVLINNNDLLSESERVDIPNENQQVLIADNADISGSSQMVLGMALPQQVIDEVICSGSNDRDSIYTICAYYKRGYKSEENIRFLENEYGSGTGKGFVIDGKEYAVVFEEEGIRIAEGRSVYSAEDSTFLPWGAVDKRIKELLSMGRYMSAADYAVVEDKLLDRAADRLWFVHRDVISPDLLNKLSLKAYAELSLAFGRHNHSEDIDVLKEVLSDTEKVRLLADETRVLIDACKGKEPMIRVRSYEFSNLGEAFTSLSQLAQDVIEYPVVAAFEPSYKSFITDDEVDFDLTRSGSHVQDGKYRIYLYFNENHSAKEKADFLKDEYGIGGGNGALGGIFDAHNNHDSKGLVLSRGSISKPYDVVNLSWSAVAHRIDNLISENRYLSDKEIENIPEYEKGRLATEICGFFDGAPLEVERPVSLGLSRDDSVEALKELLDDQAQVKKLFQAMQSYMVTLAPEARNYKYMEHCLKDVERFASGISLFDFEARKGEWAERADIDVSVAVAQDVSEDNTVYAYDINPGDTVTLFDGRFEVMSIDDNEVVVNDVDFPLFTQTYAVEEFNAIVSMEPANNVFRVPVESVVMDEVDTDINGISNDTVEEEIETAPAESPVPEVAEALPSEENVYRYYFRLKHPDDGYPTTQDNEPLKVVVLEDRPYIEDFGIRSSGYVEYAHPLSVDDLNKYDLMLYNPPIVSPETGKKYQLGFGHLGNGTTVWNRLENEHNDYKKVAHISEEGNVTLYEQNMPKEALDKIQEFADRDKAAWEKKMHIAAEALAEVEKRYEIGRAHV